MKYCPPCGWRYLSREEQKCAKGMKMKLLPQAEVGLAEFCGLSTGKHLQVFELRASLAPVVGMGH